MTGCFARSIAGHDKGELYVIVRVEDKMVCLSDGRLKKVESPKKKNKKHIQIIRNDCSGTLTAAGLGTQELRSKIVNGDKAVNEAVKRAIKLYKREEENVQS